ncbi:hypothetical protein [Nocardia sp. NPDC050710]|uniref:hypothetical protein n=1 Tax=Nocardia sp. NPDC050710 TaxID=3157220 RepID=UPI0033FD1F27
MRSAPTAIGYLRRDISRGTQQWDETGIRARAKCLGYALAKTVVFGDQTDDPEQRLVNAVRAMDADAVIAPSLAHFDGEVPETLVRLCELNVIAPRAST